MTVQTVEQQKQVYARQLAAHTLRQWNSVRQNDAQNKSGKPGMNVAESTRDEREHENRSSDSGNGRNSQPTTPGHKNSLNGKKGIQVIDYGLPSQRHGLKREGSK